MTLQTLSPILRFVLTERGWPCTDRLERMATQLPAIATAGLEMPLGQVGAIDLQQRIKSQTELDRLARWLVQAKPQGLAWQSLAGALALIAGDVDEYWLELDAPDALASEDAPLSVFVRLHDHSFSAICRIAAAFGLDLPPTRLDAIQRCLAACGTNTRLSHLGLMLGRTGAPLRLIVEGVPPADACSLLARSGWPGPLDRATEWIERLFVHADRIRLALTLTDTLSPDIGLECFVGDPAVNDPRWRCLFDMLVSNQLCTPAQREQLLTWPAALTPLSAAEWPEALITDALLRTEPDLRWLDCRISHVKVTLAHGQPAHAKGYFGFIEVQNPPANHTETQPLRVSKGTDVAIDAATTHLIGARNQAGWWLDYDGFSEGPADEWVTAYVAHVLHDSGRADARDTANRAWQLLKARARSGWGWNFLQPADADSTIWSLRLASAMSQDETPEAREATAFLLQHLQPSGGIATYRRDVYACWSDHKAVNPAWYDVHSCVTAAAALLPKLGSEPLRYLRQAQKDDGSWQGYWWHSNRYTTALASEALAATGDITDTQRVQRAVAATCTWLEQKKCIDTLHERPFEAAWALRTLMLRPCDRWEHIVQLTKLLLDTQLEDGSWNVSATLAIPNKRGEIVQAIDNQRNFTTATVLDALTRFERLKP